MLLRTFKHVHASVDKAPKDTLPARHVGWVASGGPPPSGKIGAPTGKQGLTIQTHRRIFTSILPADCQRSVVGVE